MTHVRIDKPPTPQRSLGRTALQAGTPGSGFSYSRGMNDLRYGLRALLRQPGFTAVAVISLALGIGLNTTIFSVVNAILFRSLPIERPEELVEIYSSPDPEFPHLTTSYPDFLDLRAELSTLAGVTAHGMVRGIVTSEGRSELIVGEVVTHDYFDVLGVEPALGRSFRPEEDETEGAVPVVVLSHGLWQRRLGGRPDVLGQTLRVSGVEYTILGVAPEGYSGTIPGFQPEFWAPIAMVESLSFSGVQSSTDDENSADLTRRERRGTRWLFVKGRLAPGATVEQVQAQASTVFTRLQAEYPDTNEDVGAAVLAGADVRFHPMVDNILSQAGAVLLIAVGMVLMIACANVANMLLSRAANRSREIAVRLSVGASRGRLIRQLMTESVLLAVAGGLAGVAIAYWAARLLAAFQAPLPLPVEFAFDLDASVLAYAFAASLVTALAFGLVPALRASRPSLVPALKGESTPAEDHSPRGFNLSRVLVAGQLAVSLVLLVAGALLTRGLFEANRVEVGFDPSRIAAVSFNLQMNNYTLEQAQALQRTLLDTLPGVPGVTAVALSSRLPMAPDINMEGIFVPGYHETEDDVVPLDAVYVGTDYFEVAGVGIVQGRAFDERETEGSPGVVIVNQAMAEKYWPDRSPVGERLHTGGPDGPVFEVVGVARDHKVRSLGEEPRPYVHFSRSQNPSRGTLILARTTGSAEAVLPALKDAVLEAEPEIVFTEESTAEQVVAVTLVPTQIGAGLLGAFGVLALALASIGLYGVIAYAVSRRTREVGLRMALGADAGTVLRMILSQGMRLAAVGVGVGLVLAALVARVLSGLLYGVSALDPVAYAVAALVLLLVAGAANLIPAWRASRVSPMTALRYE